MQELIKINYDTEQPTVSARELHEKLNIETPFKNGLTVCVNTVLRMEKTFGQKCPKVLEAALQLNMI